MTAEQSRAESTQRALEEQRKVMAQQMAIEREELERAKVSPAPGSAVGPPFPPDAHHAPTPNPERLAGGAEVGHAEVWGGAAAPGGRVG